MNISGILKKILFRIKSDDNIRSEMPGVRIKDEYYKTGSRRKPSLLEMELMSSGKTANTQKVYDVRSKMIKATRIKRESGYELAIEYLQNVAEECLNRKLSDLVLCVNKLIPYMKQAPSVSYDETNNYIDNILTRMPRDDGYYLNLFITKAELLKIRDLNKAANYLKKVLGKYHAASGNINFYLKLGEYFILLKKKKKAVESIKKARELLKTKRERYSHIRKQKKWHMLGRSFSLSFPSKDYNSEYLYHSFLEFLMSIALVVSPQNARMYRQYRENYQNGVWSIDKDEHFDQILNKSGLTDKKNLICAELHKYAFDEMPDLLGVTKKQLAYKRGDTESIEEISRKKSFINKPFTQYNKIEAFVNDLINRHICLPKNS